MERATAECPSPLLLESLFPDTGGYIRGRWCRVIDLGAGPVSCCLPCPVSEWRYSDGFDGKMLVAGWCAIAIIVSMVVMALTYTVLPTSATGRHYLTTVPMIGFILVPTAYIVPLSRAPNQCHDTITPNDHRSDRMCAATASLLMGGIWVVVIGCLFRSLSLHLMVMWDRTLGKKYMYASLSCIILGTLVLLILDFEVTGVSYQLGRVCYINPFEGWGTFWIPLIVITALTFLLQALTMGYCVFTVLRPILQKSIEFSPRHLPQESVEYRQDSEARQTSIQTRKILRMQWRPIIIVFMIVLNVTFISTVFIEVQGIYTYPTERFVPWAACLVLMGGKDNCMSQADKLGPPENLIVAALILLAICGLWGVILFARSSMLLAWIDLFKGSLRPKIRLLDAEVAAEAVSPSQFPPRARSGSSDCELIRLPKRQCVSPVISEDFHSDYTYVVTE
ncbi:hypothetical protein OIDMADRAFT_184664 [Oidiodendron maius Zn]|uniref:G-protein coupled receptors family 2 profile 2 domain-containing protein n=1 Tax=Oidiodendron maius (strain Zn) TaxID=913774 RepID=A0A0C3GTI6_OIDMZ|nr:hypothetical protein OIDMADRAFT_184664 [Oidiodendron maius Zn]